MHQHRCQWHQSWFYPKSTRRAPEQPHDPILYSMRLMSREQCGRSECGSIRSAPHTATIVIAKASMSDPRRTGPEHYRAVL